jgi:hypothetical protein
MSSLNIKKKEIDNALQKAKSEATSSVKAIRLDAFSKICEEFVRKSVQLKITLVVKWMTENGHKISNQSIYNKQEGANPYRILFDLWSEYDTLKRSSSKPVVRESSSFDDFIDDKDLMLIEDPALRYRVSLMYGELKGLRKQNDLMKQVKDMNVIQSVPEHLIESKSESKFVLDDYEIEILKELVSSRSDVGFSDDGALVANLPIRKGKLLSNQGLKEALTKVLNSYQVGAYG